MDPQQPGESGTKSTTGIPPAPPSQPSPGTGKYPKPPALPLRMLLLCLKPEAWAAAARYPSRFTFIPLALAILIAAIVIGIADGARFSNAVIAFAPSFPPMEVSSDGVLKPKDKLKEPIQMKFYPFRFVVDPSSKTELDSIKVSKMILITDHEIVQRGIADGEVRYPLTSLSVLGFSLPEKGKTALIDSNALRNAASRLGTFFGLMFGIGQLVGDLLWTLLILYFLRPVVTIAASVGRGGLILPKRAAYRMAAALLVPLILFNAIMHAAGYSAASSLGADGSMLLWFFGAVALAIWTGIMARHMFAPARRRPTPPR